MKSTKLDYAFLTATDSQRKIFVEEYLRQQQQKRKQYYHLNEDRLKRYRDQNRERQSRLNKVNLGRRSKLPQVYYGGNKEKVLRQQKDFTIMLKERKRSQNDSEQSALLNSPDFPNYLSSLERDLEITDLDDWFYVTDATMKSNSQLIYLVSIFGSLPQFLKRAYPHKQWTALRFLSQSPATWHSTASTRLYLSHLQQKMRIKQPEDWYSVSLKLLRDQGAGRCLYAFQNQIFKMLNFAFPEVSWKKELIAHKGKKSVQRWIYFLLRSILPQEINIFENYYHPSLHNGSRMQLDVWVDAYNFGLEYQGQQHYYDMSNTFGSSYLPASTHKDSVKQQVCRDLGISLIAVPFWWDGKENSLIKLIVAVRPDLCDIFTKKVQDYVE